MWVINGRRGLAAYRQRRCDDHEDGFPIPDCFHDGHRVLEAVKDEHSRALGQMRRCDAVTQSVVNLVDDMMREDPTTRPTSVDCWKRARGILQDAKTEPAFSSTPELAPDLEADAETEAKQSRPSRLPSVRTRKLTESHHEHWNFPDLPLRGLAEDSDQPLTEKAFKQASPTKSRRSRPDTDAASPGHMHSSANAGRSIASSAGSPRSAREASSVSTGADARPLPPYDHSAKEEASPLQNREISRVTAAQNQGRPPAHLPYLQAKRWMDRWKNGERWAELGGPDDAHFAEQLAKRDHVRLTRSLAPKLYTNGNRSSSSTTLSQ